MKIIEIFVTITGISDFRYPYQDHNKQAAIEITLSRFIDF